MGRGEIKKLNGVIAKLLKTHRIKRLIAIGRDGSFRDVDELHRAKELPVIGVPAAIHNE
jgi:6-phosphofructokinase